jgi:predicted KAP-like P-loop ATPase
MKNILKVENPIKSKKEDLLDRVDFTNKIAHAISEYQLGNNESLTIGLFGKWGSGKTSLINMITEDLKDKEDILIFKFEPWLYSDTEQLISQFFKNFSKTIKYNNYGEKAKEIGEELETYANFFDVFSYIPEPKISSLSMIASKIFKMFGKASKEWGELKSKNLSEIKASIEEHLENFDKKILIIIDDIDRLNNSEIKQIFQLIRSLANFPNTIYLISMERDVVVKALEDVQKGNGSEYLEKIVHVPIEVPFISEDIISDILVKHLNEVLVDIDEEDFDKEYWASIYYSGFKDFFKNIRDIIRFMNVFRFNFFAIGKDVNIVDLMVITAFQVFEPKIYEDIKNNSEIYLKISIDNTDYNIKKEHIENMSNYLQKLKKETYKKLLKELFPAIYESNYLGFEKECRKEAKICDPETFEIYFKVSLSEDILTKTQMSMYIESASDEDELRKIIKLLNEKGKIYKFLEKLEDYLEKIDESKTKNIIKILMEEGNSFPEIRGMFEIGKESRIARIILKLLENIKNKSVRFKILKEVLEEVKNNIDIPVFIVFSIIKNDEKAYDDEKIISDEQVNELKNILKNKIKEWAKQYSFKDDKISLFLLYRWKELDENSLKEYVNSKIKDINELLHFLKLFSSIVYSQTIGNYYVKEKKKFLYKDITDFVDYDYIERKIRNLNIENYPEDIQFAVKMFLEYFDEKIKDDI